MAANLNTLSLCLPPPGGKGEEGRGERMGGKGLRPWRTFLSRAAQVGSGNRLFPGVAPEVSLGRGQQDQQGLPGNAPGSRPEAYGGEAAVADHAVDGPPGQAEDLRDFVRPE
jgi:hypothetical protein